MDQTRARPPGGLIDHRFRGGRVEQLAPRFWLEAIAIVAFGVSWLTKGEAILKDQETPSVAPQKFAAKTQ